MAMMTKIRVLQTRVYAHKRRDVGEEIAVSEDVARALTEQDPEGFAWVDRPVQQFVDLVEPAPVAESDLGARVSKRGRKAEVGDGDESTKQS